MARLIDANALMDAFRSYMVERWDKEKCVSEENCKTCEKSCLWRKIVSAAPTVDAVPVVHGRWQRELVPIDIMDIHRYRDTCSECGGKIDFLWRDSRYNYCPNCGAKMDGGNGDDRV